MDWLVLGLQVQMGVWNQMGRSVSVMMFKSSVIVLKHVNYKVYLMF